MGLNLPESGNVFLPEVPTKIAEDNKLLYDYLQRVRKQLDSTIRGLFNNDLHIATAINSGTSGIFTLSSGGSIIVTSGIVLRVTS